jgi:phenylacetic acid degradation operon negative regulatory protein
VTPRPLDPILQHLRRAPSRSGSIVVTIYGDAIAPRGGSLWLGTLLALFAALDIGEGVVRTAVSRLAADGWLARNRVGRNSFYRLGPKGSAVFAAAAARIYDPHPTEGEGVRLVLPGNGARADLLAAGYGTAAPGVLVAPGDAIVPEAGNAIVLHATGTPEALHRLVRQAWPLDRLADSYRRFTAAFAPLRDPAGWAPLEALLARILLVHEYRRIVLRDPLLPAALLPPDWPGAAARALCAGLYPALLDASEAWLDAHAVAETGPLPPAGAALRARFRA